MNDTTRRFPRSLREAFPSDYRTSAVEVTPTRTWRGEVQERITKSHEQCTEFLRIFRMYRKAHGVIYSARSAFDRAVRDIEVPR